MCYQGEYDRGVPLKWSILDRAKEEFATMGWRVKLVKMGNDQKCFLWLIFPHQEQIREQVIQHLRNLQVSFRETTIPRGNYNGREV
jgi:hypothetical protein